MTLQDQSRTPYADALARHRDRIRHRFMIPGHAANQYGGGSKLARFLGDRALSLDIPQLISGIDIGENHAYGESRRLAAEAWSARTTWFLTNGASQGNRMALMALATLGDRVLVQRSSHSSVYDGLVMSGLEPVYAMPLIDATHHTAQGVTADEVEHALVEAMDQGRPIAGVIVVSPSYFGVVADLPAISKVCRAHGAVLVVDGSWGAHFGFHPGVPECPTRLGADIVLSSIHKLGGSLTQTAMLHLSEGTRGSADGVTEALESALNSAYLLTESTSLNSLLLASLDIARSELATGRDRIGEALNAAAELRRLIREHPLLRLAEDDFAEGRDAAGIDPLHVSIDVRHTGMSGMRLKHELSEGSNATFLEIATPTTIVALIGAFSSPEPVALIDAIERVEATASEADAGGVNLGAEPLPGLPTHGEALLTPRQAYLSQHETVPAGEAVGRVSASMLAAYPPGIPNLVPGEIVTDEAIAYLREVARTPGGYVRGAEDPGVTRLRVCADKR
ncbi:aminotransferase class I/II-fold pyridoxal phosphate-dependent enzyme [Leucobacter sp. W1153]|uniref:aminotransferase class I/II-fold pyridoxal phosphate-dependent enzyme n=1 Tax=Leucobacter sp. W1153 TaxID=3439064 RepID=UPI003F3362B3